MMGKGAGRRRSTPVTLAGPQPESRPARTVDRYPSGKLKPDGAPRSHIKRVVKMALRKAADPLLGTSLGWLRLEGKLTDDEVVTGVAFAKLRGQADRALGLPRRNAASPSYEDGFRGVGAAHDFDGFKEANSRFCELKTVLQASAAGLRGRRMLGILDEVCVEGVTPAYFELDLLKAGLAKCAVFFQRGSPKKKRAG